MHYKNKTLKNEKIGAVMVIGGGVSGMQASLDLANAGYYVYLASCRSGAIRLKGFDHAQIFAMFDAA